MGLRPIRQITEKVKPYTNLSIYHAFDTSANGFWCHFRTQALQEAHCRTDAANLRAQATNKSAIWQKRFPREYPNLLKINDNPDLDI